MFTSSTIQYLTLLLVPQLIQLQGIMYKLAYIIFPYTKSMHSHWPILKAVTGMATASVNFTQYCLPFSHGALLVLVMSGLLYVVHWCVYNAIEFSFRVTL